MTTSTDGKVMRNGKASYTFLVVILLLLAAGGGVFAWYRLYRAVPQPAWIAETPRTEFLYGSVGAEQEAGIPYWIWLALPRVFSEYQPGQGGYASFGLSWEETREMPVGLSKKTIGYTRVAGNCALCHAYSRPTGVRQPPTVFAAAMGHTAEVQKVLNFYKQCANDPRFNADNLLPEIESATQLSFLDRLWYRYVLIPKTRERLRKGDLVILDAALWRHSQDPHANSAELRQRLQTLAASLTGEEKDQLTTYLKTLP